MSPRTRLLASAAVAVAAILGSGLGCGYHLSGRGSNLPAHVKTIGVPGFDNDTTRPELGQRVTEQVIRQLTGRKYKVVPESRDVDAVLGGRVVSWTSRPLTHAADDSTASRVAVTLTASVTFEDLVQKRVLWTQERYTFTAEYDVIGDPDSYFDTELGAVEDVAEDFARAVVSAALQGF